MHPKLPRNEDNTCMRGGAWLKPNVGKIPPYSVAFYPLYGGDYILLM